MRRPLLAAALAALALPASAQDTRTVTDDLGRTVEVPADPQRIVVTEGQSLAIPLIELGLVPVGSHGMLFDGGTPILRGGAVTTGIDFATSDIAFLGTGGLDLEAMAALEPDLIMHSLEVEPYVGVDAERLSAIVPVVALRSFERPAGEIHERLAEITGAEADLARLEARHAAQIAQLSRLADPEGTVVSVFQPDDGQIYAERTYGTLGHVLRDAGLEAPEAIENIAEGEGATFSAESLPEFDADWIVLTYRTDAGETPEDSAVQMEAVVPGWCEALSACREGRALFLPRDEATAPSFAAAMAVAFALATHLFDPLRQPE